MRFVLALLWCLIAGIALAQPLPTRPTLGIAISDLPPTARVHGAWVHQVVPDSAASVAGLQPNDVIIGIDGHPVAAASFLTDYIRSRQTGDTIALEILRPAGNNVAELTLTAHLGSSSSGSQTPGAASQTPSNSADISSSTVPSTGGAATGALDQVQWISFIDPNEQAFSTEVPRGWYIGGGIARRSAIGATPYLRMLSPERQAYIVVGDPSISLFTTPLRSSSVRPAWQGQVIRNYMSSIPFARDYVMRRLPATCGNVRVLSQRNRSDLTHGRWASANPGAHHSGGEVIFSCRRNGVEMHGSVIAETYIFPRPANIGGALWTVDLLAGYFAPPDKGAAVGAMMVHVIDAWRWNPEWLRVEQAKIEAAARGVNDATAAMVQMDQQALARAQRTMRATQRQGEAFDRVINGSSPYVDAAGNTYQLDNTKTEWITPDGRIVGTTGASPGPGSQQLKEVPP